MTAILQDDKKPQYRVIDLTVRSGKSKGQAAVESLEKSVKVPGVTDYIWSDIEEPHCQRKKEIIAKYGKQVNELMGVEPRTKYLTLLVLALHLGTTYYVCHLSWTWMIVSAYLLGGTFTQILFLAIHEITHGLAFRKAWMNDALSMVANFPIGVPYSMMFKHYHHEHHRYQGWDGIDTDVPTELEAKLFNSQIGKIFFATFQIVFYAFRPMCVRFYTPTVAVAMNWFLQFVVFDYFVAWPLFGIDGFIYFLFSVFFAGSLHPLAGHFLSEHYIEDPEQEQETYSYYGPLNKIAWNVGYHNEHHDFPGVAWSKLPQLRELAPEYYEHLVQTKSWPGTIWWFLTDPNVGTYTRIKRERSAAKRETLLPTTPPATPVRTSPIAPTAPSTIVYIEREL